MPTYKRGDRVRVISTPEQLWNRNSGRLGQTIGSSNFERIYGIASTKLIFTIVGNYPERDECVLETTYNGKLIESNYIKYDDIQPAQALLSKLKDLHE